MLSATLALKAATFNAKDYGAVGDDKTDNTAAFSKFNWWVVRGNVGAVDEFKITGGKGIRSRRIGAENVSFP